MATKITQIKSFSYNSVSYAGMLTVTYDDGIDNIIRNKSDDDLGAREGLATSASTTGTITGIDRNVFGSIPKGETETLTFVGFAVEDSTDVTTTITTCMMLKENGLTEHDGDGGASLTFEAFYADGQTSPVTVS